MVALLVASTVVARAGMKAKQKDALMAVQKVEIEVETWDALLELSMADMSAEITAVWRVVRREWTTVSWMAEMKAEQSAVMKAGLSVEWMVVQTVESKVA